MMSEVFRSTVLSRTAAAIAVLACAAAGAAQGQQNVGKSAASVSNTLFAAASTQPLDLASVAGVNYSSSLSSDFDSAGESSSAPTTIAAERLNLTSAGLLQPPPRRYGHPRYNDSSHNADGSSKYGFEAGVGFELPVANTYHYYNTSWAFSVGAGRNFSKKFGVMAQFDYDHFGVNGQTLQNQTNLYNVNCSVAAGTCVSGLDGNNHIWSFSLNPTYTFMQGDKLGAYAVAGVGFYHKVTNFTVPSTQTYCDYFYGCYQYEANATIDHYTSNAPGFSAGLGFTYKASRFANERFFVEGRYVFVDNSQKPGFTYANYTTTTYSGNNLYPPNSNRTTYIPIKVGVRF